MHVVDLMQFLLAGNSSDEALMSNTGSTNGLEFNLGQSSIRPSLVRII